MLGDSIKKFALSQAFSYIEKDPHQKLNPCNGHGGQIRG